METRVESAVKSRAGPPAAIRVRMLGPFAVHRDGAALALPASRKLRALLAWLALAAQPVGRSRLCELLWDVPNDPRGELRWSLSKLRSVLDEPGRRRVVTDGDTVALDLADCAVDAVAVADAAEAGFATLDAERLQALARLFAGDFLDGLEIDRSPHFQSWLAAQRRRFRTSHAAILEQLAGRLPPDSDARLASLEQWVAVAPYDERAHLSLLAGLAGRGQVDAGEAHLAATARLFDAEGLDVAPLRTAWLAARDRRPAAPAAVAAVAASDPAKPDPAKPDPVLPDPAVPEAPGRASLAVMPFLEQRAGLVVRGGVADGLTHDIITRLAKLRSLFVIARGSVFALAERNIGPEDAGRRLNVDYVVSGAVRQQTGRIVVTVELVEARTARIVWTEAFDHKLDGALIVLDEIGNRIVSSIAAEVETVERNRAILKPPSSLDAWEAYHRGLWHMYRFTREENEAARHFFQMAVRLDPTFARAHAGLSFTHWQSAFQHWADREQESDRAFEAAGQSLIVDDHDPAAHWAMGRALWLRGRQEDALGELERAVDLSPNFALGHYALSFVQSQSGDPQAAIGSSDWSRRLSPYDPLLFGMLGTRALAHVRLGQFPEAAEWALKAAARPNAHPTIVAIAAHCLALAGRDEEGRAFAASIRKSLPHYCFDDFLATFRFAPDAAALFRQGARRIGLA